MGLSLAGVKYYEAYERRVLLSLAGLTFLLAALLLALAVLDFDDRDLCISLGPSHIFDLALALILTRSECTSKNIYDSSCPNLIRRVCLCFAGFLGWELVRFPFLLGPISLARLVLRAIQVTRRRSPASLCPLAQLGLFFFIGVQIQIRTLCGERWVQSLCLILIGVWVLIRSRTWPLRQRLLALLAFATLAIFPTLPPTRKTVNAETR